MNNNPVGAQSSAREDAEDLEARRESNTTVPTYYRKTSSGNMEAVTVTGDDSIGSHVTTSKKSPTSGDGTKTSRYNRRLEHADREGYLNERTPLLDPSDPLVTPLNLQSVRILNITLWTLLGLSCLWFLLLFINTFITIPVPFLFPRRDSGFVELALMGISILCLAFTLTFFTYPTNAEKIIGATAVGTIALAFLVSIAFPRLRHKFGWSGAIIMGWTLLSLTLGLVVSPKFVEWGKIHEEVRLTGRQETRRTCGEWATISFSVMLMTIFVVIPTMLISFNVFLDFYDLARLHDELGVGHFIPIYTSRNVKQRSLFADSLSWDADTNPILFSNSSAYGTGHGESGYADPGSGYGSHYNVYVYCTPRQGGNGHHDAPPSIRPGPHGEPAPIVLLEADTFTSAQRFYDGWVDDLYNSNKIAQVCYWNRPGRGFSENAPSPFSLGMGADALTEALLRALQIKEPLDDGDDDGDHKIGVPPHRRRLFDGGLGKNKSVFGNYTFAAVGHGFGGLYSRMFAAKHLSNMHSLTLIDSFPEELLVRRVGTPVKGFWWWVKGLYSVLGIERQLSWIIRARNPADRLLGKMSYSTRPSELKASLQEQISALGVMRNDIDAANSVLQGSDLPLAVLSSAQAVRKDTDWSNYQRKLTKVTAKNVAWEILEGPHDLWLTSKARLKMQEILVNLLGERDPTN